MPAGNTYEAIATYTVTSTQGAITFSSIPSTYTDLVIVGSVLGNGSTSVNFYFNGDTASNYSYIPLDGSGASTASPRQNNTGGIQFAGWSSNLNSTTSPSTMVANIMSYKNTNVYKTAIVRSMALGSASSCVSAFTGTWRSTAAINSITINSSFLAGTVYSLYGIAAA